MAAGQRTISIKFAGSTSGLEKATSDAKVSLDGVAETTDGLATKTGTLTGAFGALAGGLSLVGLEKYAPALETAAMATDLVSGASDIATVALESLRLKEIATKIATIASSAATKAAAIATGVWTGAQWLLNAAMSANPIGIVVLAIVALIAIFVLAYQKSETFRAIVTAAWNGIKAAAEAVGNWFTKTLWPALQGVWNGIQRGVSSMVGNVQKQWTAIKSAVGDVKDWIVEKFDAVVSFFGGLPKRIGKATSGMWNGIKDAFRSAVNWLIEKWNGLSLTLGGQKVSLPFGKSFSIPSVTLSTPDIGYLAKGGDALAGRSYVVGERGPELLTMGSRAGHVTPNHELTNNRPIVVENHIEIGGEVVKVVRTEIRENDRNTRRLVGSGIGGAR